MTDRTALRVALGSRVVSSGYERNFKKDEMEPFVKFRGSLEELISEIEAVR
jgi:hypothetical protein